MSDSLSAGYEAEERLKEAKIASCSETIFRNLDPYDIRMELMELFKFLEKESHSRHIWRLMDSLKKTFDL